MRHNALNISFPDKIISVFSYFSMGIFGLLYAFFAYFCKKKINFFLMYNIAQSMIISIFLALFNIVLKVILQIIILIPFLSKIGIRINMFLQERFIFWGLSFNKLEIVIFILLIYISIGVLLGKIFVVPFLTKIMKMVMHSYK